MTAKPLSSQRDIALDILRAMAILMVLGYHLFPDRIPLGYLGVDVFFVLSGVFIARQIGQRDAGALPYLRRRFLRLWPAILAMLMCIMALGWFILLPQDYAHLGLRVLASIAFLSNFAGLVPGGYFGPDAGDMPLLHMWSLGVEMQIYVAAALLLPFCVRRVPLPVILVFIAAGSLAWAIYSAADPFTFYDPAARAWQFAIGGLAGLLRGNLARIPHLVTLTGLLLLGGPTLAQIEASPLFLAIATSAITCAFIIFASPDPMHMRPIQDVFAWIGRSSYGAYLWHWPLIVLIDKALLVERDALLSFWIGGVSIVLGGLSRTLIERPFQRSGTNAAPWRGISLAMTAILIAAGAFGALVSAGAPKRLPQDAHAILDVTRPAHPLHQSCHIFPDYPRSGFPVSDSCRHNADKGRIRTAVLGDSHAMTLSGGLLRAGLPFVEYSYSGCAPTTTLYPQTHGPACPERVEDAIDAIRSDPDIETVIIAARWAFYTQPRFDNGRGGRDRHPDTVMRNMKDDRVASDLRVRSAMRETILGLLADGKRVLTVGPTPVFGWDIRNTAARAAWYGGDVDLTIPRDLIENRQKHMIAMLEKIDKPGYEFLEARSLFCDEATCRPYSKDRALLFTDQDHLSQNGADLLASFVLGNLRRLSP